MTQRFYMKISYNGKNYIGWQIQPSGKSIQEIIEKALSQILQKNIRITGSGRTDSGVHALCQMAHFDLSKPVNPSELKWSLNKLLPPDIRILELDNADPTFHARYNAKEKTYRYYFSFDEILSPFDIGYIYHIRKPLDIELMKKGAEKLTGTHDFTSFTNKGTIVKSHVRTIYSIELIHQKDHSYCLEFKGNGFLYKMVRNLSGALFDLGHHKITLDDLNLILEEKDRRKAPRAAPAHGLFLANVAYNPNSCSKDS
ncbi:MAG TPA: tRNA pseudouridine(38-40) synthase TruA [Chlamydiales bacterium]|nr:tRNA pseudouridine(38-40) synthase TruA [Chlamydiales bacterium]